MMKNILKSLIDNDVAIPVIVLGLVREARLWHKQVLEHRAKRTKK